jgi:hypothetical protein
MFAAGKVNRLDESIDDTEDDLPIAMPELPDPTDGFIEVLH